MSESLPRDDKGERVAQLIAHRACGNQEQDLASGKLAGYCVVCQIPWPCAYAGTPPSHVAPKPDWIEEELKDGDRICEAAGVQRTEGGRLPVAKIVNKLNAAPQEAAARASSEVDRESGTGNAKRDGPHPHRTYPGSSNGPAGAAPSTTRQSAKQRFDELLVEDTTPLERLRFFCSLAMEGQDWIDVEPFFDALESAASATPCSVTDAMVNRFLSWKLPKAFHPDAGISFKRYFNVEYNAKHGKPPQCHEPTGTNLLTATQAREMLEHVMGTTDGTAK